MSDIGAVGLGSTVDLLTNAISGADLEHAAISNNIANVNTPNYERQSVSFKDALSAAIGEPAQGDDLTLMTNDDRQFGDASGTPQPFDPQVDLQDRPDARGRQQCGRRSRDRLEPSENSGYSQTMSQLLQVQFARLREAITENSRTNGFL